MKTVVVHFQLGNVGSVVSMLKKIGVSAELSSDPAVIGAADRLILPGVGAFDRGMTKLRELALVDVLNRKALEENVPILGICLGMQLLTAGSEEGSLPGLGWIDGETVKFRFEKEKLKIPHVGWNFIQPVESKGLFAQMGEDSRFYFTHSYHVVLRDSKQALARTNYGYDFVSSVGRKNIFGVQFHPEKSHRYGVQLLENFMELVP